MSITRELWFTSLFNTSCSVHNVRNQWNCRTSFHIMHWNCLWKYMHKVHTNGLLFYSCGSDVNAEWIPNIWKLLENNLSKSLVFLNISSNFVCVYIQNTRNYAWFKMTSSTFWLHKLFSIQIIFPSSLEQESYLDVYFLCGWRIFGDFFPEQLWRCIFIQPCGLVFLPDYVAQSLLWSLPTTASSALSGP